MFGVSCSLGGTVPKDEPHAVVSHFWDVLGKSGGNLPGHPTPHAPFRPGVTDLRPLGRPERFARRSLPPGTAAVWPLGSPWSSRSTGPTSKELSGSRLELRQIDLPIPVGIDRVEGSPEEFRDFVAV